MGNCSFLVNSIGSWCWNMGVADLDWSRQNHTKALVSKVGATACASNCCLITLTFFNKLHLAFKDHSFFLQQSKPPTNSRFGMEHPWQNGWAKGNRAYVGRILLSKLSDITTPHTYKGATCATLQHWGRPRGPDRGEQSFRPVACVESSLQSIVPWRFFFSGEELDISVFFQENARQIHSEIWLEYV